MLYPACGKISGIESPDGFIPYTERQWRQPESCFRFAGWAADAYRAMCMSFFRNFHWSIRDCDETPFRRLRETEQDLDRIQEEEARTRSED